MPNVKFKRGTQAALNALIAGSGNRFEDGSFYLTSDTDRLYVAQSATELVELNQSIEIVDSISQLPQTSAEVAVGQFYYVSGTNLHNGEQNNNGNILAVCTSIAGGVPTWTQVNPDTNTDTGYEFFEKGANTGMVVSAGTVEQANNRIKYTITLHPKKTGVNGVSTTTTLNDITADFYVNSSDIGTITSATAVKVSSAAVANNKTTVNVSGNGADTTGGFTLAAGSNVTLSGGGSSDITIAATDTTYTMSSATSGTSDAKVSLTPSANGTAGTAQNVYFKAGTDLTVNGATAGEITYAHATYGTPTAATGTAETFNSGNTHTFSVVDGVTTSNGHVTAVTKKDITVKDTTYTANTITADNQGHLTFTIKDSGNQTSTASSSDNSGSPVLFHKITIDGTEVTKYNQQSLGSFYSAAQVDSLIAGLNAMTYKGTVGTGGDVASLTTTATASDGVKVGDTYMVKSNGAGPSSGSKVGDLYIATGTETNGVIVGTVTWELVPAGNDIDTHYTFSVAADGTISANPDTGAASVTVAQITGTSPIAVAGDASTGVITVSHSNSGVTAGTKGDNSAITSALGYSGTFKVPTVTVDAKGHVTGLSEQTITLPASDNTTYSISATQASGQAAKITLTSGGAGNSTTTNAYVVGDGTSISTSVPSSGANQDNLVITHNNLLSSGTAGTAYGVSASTTPAAGSGVIKVPNVTVNAQGHVTTITEQSITLPADTHYSFQDTSVAVSSNTATATFTLGNNQDNTTSTSTLEVSSSSLTIDRGTLVNGKTDEIKIDIEWGTF